MYRRMRTGLALGLLAVLGVVQAQEATILLQGPRRQEGRRRHQSARSRRRTSSA